MSARDEFERGESQTVIYARRLELVTMALHLVAVALYGLLAVEILRWVWP